LNCGQPLIERQANTSLDRLRQYIPRELLAKLEASQAAGGMPGERRVITMLFCDVAGSTAAADKLDPEEWAEIINGAFDYLIAPVYRYEGTLARLMGDAILAFFGAPISHEDDPQRAVLAGLDMVQGIRLYREEVKRKWGLDFQVRVGINTGLVVVGEVGSDLRVEYTAMGDAINLAARMEQTARPDTVQIAEDTYRSVAPLFEFENLGGIEVKGKSEPVKAYRVLRPKEEPGALRGIAGLDSPLVGREREMNQLRDRIADLQQGSGQVVSVMGEAGLGKSRLISELRYALIAEEVLPAADSGSMESPDNDARPSVGWHEGRSFSYETTTPYAPFVSLLSRHFGFGTEHTDTQKYHQIEAHVARLMPDRVEEVAPFIGVMMGLELQGEASERVKYLQPPQVRDRVFRAVCGFFQQLAEQRPLVLVFEDLQWIDPTSLELLEQLMAVTDRAPLMIIGVFRPWRQEPSWRFHEIAARDYVHRYTSLMLEPLDEAGTRELVANLLEIEDLPEKVRALVLTKAEGNPFYVEEVIRSLLDSGMVVRQNSHWRATRDIENIAVPDTLAGVITARLDRLSEESKSVAQTASVIGREFQYDTLSDVHDTRQSLNEVLTDLQRRELIRERARLPQQIYLFKHVLTQETVYSSLLLSRRRQLHRRVAECLEHMEPDRVGDIARHFLEAQEEQLALPYLVDAGDRTARAYSTSDAIGFYNRALAILENNKDPQLARRAYEGLGSALSCGQDILAAVENYHQMFHAAQEYSDQPMQVSALNKLGFITALVQGQFPEAEKHLVEAENLAEECGDLPGLAELHMTYCYLRVPFGEFDDAVEHLSKSASIGQQLDLEEPKLFGLTHTATTLTYMTRFDEAWQAAQEAFALAEELGNRRWQAELLALPISFHHLMEGNLGEVLRSAQDGADRAAQIGAVEQEAYGALMSGQVCWMRGEYEQAIAHQQHMLQAGRASGLPFLEAAALCSLGTTYLDISPEYTHQATEYHGEALGMMDKPLGSVMGGMMWAQMGFRALVAGELERAGEFFQNGLTVSTALKYLARPHALIGAAFVALAGSDVDEADKLVTEAHSFVQERGMKHMEPLVSLARAQVNVARGEAEQALESLVQTETLAQQMQMRPLVLQARLGAAQVLAAMGQAENQEVKLGEARDMIEEIGGLFQDEDMRRLYVENATSKLA